MRWSLFASLLFISACVDNQTPPQPFDVSDDQYSADAGTDSTQSDSGAISDVVESFVPPFMRGSIYERGEYNVGYRTWDISYDALEEPGRTLRLAVWYPTRDAEGTTSRYADLINRPDAFLDATLAPDGPYPVMIFSHGNTSLAEQSYFYTEYFTSHGFVVVAPEHTGNTFRDAEGGISFEAASYRPPDITAVLDRLEELPSTDPLFGQLTDQIVLSGHSFGGYTTLASMGATFNVDTLLDLCENGTVPADICDVFSGPQLDAFRAGFFDPRVKLGIPQTPAGALIFGAGLRDIQNPILLWTAGRDATLPPAQEGNPIWNLLGPGPNTGGEGPPHIRIDLQNAGHFTFSNMCELFPFIPEVANDGCGDDFIPIERAFPLINAYSMAFVRKHFGDTDDYDALLDGSDEPFDEQLQLSVK